MRKTKTKVSHHLYENSKTWCNKIAESNDELARKNSHVSEAGSDKVNGSLPRKKSTAGDENKENEPEEKLIEAEKTETGSVKWKVYKYYFETIGILVGLAVIVLYIIAQAFNIGSNLWLSAWATDKNVTSEKRDLYLGVYGALGLAQGNICKPHFISQLF